MISREEYNLTFIKFTLSENLKIDHPSVLDELGKVCSECYIVDEKNKTSDNYVGMRIAKLTDFILCKQIMIGLCTYVYFAKYRDLQDNYKYIIIKITNREDKVLNGCFLQIKALNSDVKGNNRIMPIYDIIKDKYNDEKVYAIIMPVGRHNLYQAYSHIKPSLSVMAKYILQVSEAIYCCHKNSIVHRDIKSDNFIVMADGNIKLTDFDFAENADEETQLKEIVGTYDYMSPEIVAAYVGNYFYTRSCDLWALGILIYDICLNDLPFTEPMDDRNDIFMRIVSFNYKNIKNINLLPENFKKLCELLITGDSESRATIVDILEIVENIEIL